LHQPKDCAHQTRKFRLPLHGPLRGRQTWPAPTWWAKCPRCPSSRRLLFRPRAQKKVANLCLPLLSVSCRFHILVDQPRRTHILKQKTCTRKEGCYIISVTTETTDYVETKENMKPLLASLDPAYAPVATVWTYLGYLGISVALTI